MNRTGLVNSGLMVIAFCSGCSAQKKADKFWPAEGGPIAVGKNPADLSLADVNNDGKLDILTANAGSKDVTIFSGDGSGQFHHASGSPFKVKDQPHLIAGGDLDNDGNLDLALTSHDSYEIMIMLGDGRGNFAESKNVVRAVEAERPHNHGLALADVNGDKNLDIITSNNGLNSVSVLLGDGKLNFTHVSASPYPVGRQPYPLTVADMNGDGFSDILTPNVGSASISLILSDGKGGFRSSSTIEVAARPFFLTTGDLNKDSQIDIVASHDDVNLVTILHGDGKGGFKPAPVSPLDVGTRVWEMALVDLSADGNIDLVMAAVGNNYVIVLLGNGKGRFEPAPGSPYKVGSWHSGLAAGDVNSDGKPDIIVTNPELDNVVVLLNRFSPVRQNK